MPEHNSCWMELKVASENNACVDVLVGEKWKRMQTQDDRVVVGWSRR